MNPPSPLREPSETPEAWVARWSDGGLAWIRHAEQWDWRQERAAKEAGLTLTPLYRRSALPVDTPELKAVRREIADRITQYLSVGGTWNPEMMDHDKVRDLLFDCRDALTMDAK